eukprot:scaffold11931_cov56-Cyclotella_meneghiniana.AAC.3
MIILIGQEQPQPHPHSSNIMVIPPPVVLGYLFVPLCVRLARQIYQSSPHSRAAFRLRVDMMTKPIGNSVSGKEAQGSTSDKVQLQMGGHSDLQLLSCIDVSSNEHALRVGFGGCPNPNLDLEVNRASV